MSERDARYAQCTLQAASDRQLAVDWADSVQVALALLRRRKTGWRNVLIDEDVASSGGVDLLASLAPCAQKPLIILVTTARFYERAIEQYRSGQLLLPKPSSGRALIDLVLAMGNMPEVGLSAREGYGEVVVGDLVLQPHALLTPDSTITLRSAEARLLRYLFTRRGRLATTEEIAHAIFERRDRSSAVLVRRHVANTRAALGTWSWLIESVPRQGYRVAKSCLERPGPSAPSAAAVRQRTSTSETDRYRAQSGM